VDELLLHVTTVAKQQSKGWHAESSKGSASLMVEFWKEWEGKLIDDFRTLEQYLFGTEEHAVFLSQTGDESQQRAAIKIILGDPAATERQLKLWEAAAALSHAHLIRILSMGKSQRGGMPFIYLVTEYADENLSQVISDRPLTEKETREILGPTLDTLEYIHSQGFAHGHLKPSNFMAVDNCLKLSSDRLCPFRGRDNAARDSYSPPERNWHSAAGDVWSLGVTLVEALTQRVPALDASGQPLLRESLPEPFREIVGHCLQRDPQARWTVSDISASLQPPIHTRPERSAKRSNGRWFYIGAIVAAVVLLAILILPRVFHRRAVSPVAPRDVVVPHPVPTPGPAATSPPKAMSSPAPAAKPVVSEVVKRVLPDIPAKARSTIRGKVKIGVRVGVDGSGSVTDARLESPGPSKYFAQLAVKAARQWRFTPMEAGERNVRREWTLRFEISRSETNVAIARMSH
jgi:TonB family protein